MKTRLGGSALLIGVLGAGLFATTVPAHAAPRRAPATTVHLATKATSGNVVTTDRGVVFAMWSTGPHTRLEWAVKRPGKAWSRPQVKASWRVGSGTHGQPVLTTASHHRVLAAWLDQRRQVVAAYWSPHHGWAEPSYLGNPHQHVDEDVSVASSGTGEVAVAWGSAYAGSTNPLKTMAAVRRDGHWVSWRLGPKAASSGRPKGPAVLGVDDAGDVTAAWEDWHSGDADVMVKRIKAGSLTWDPRQDLGVVDEAFNVPPVGLAVQPDGAEMVNPEVNSPEPTGVLTRVGDDPWTSVGDQPFGTDSLSTPSGALVTWNAGPISEDPDGIAGPAPFDDLGRAAFPASAGQDHVFLASDGTLVDVTKDRHSLMYAVLPPGGPWSAVRTVHTFQQTRVMWSSTMSGDGQVTVLLGAKVVFDGVHLQSRLDAVTFDATS